MAGCEFQSRASRVVVRGGVFVAGCACRSGCVAATGVLRAVQEVISVHNPRRYRNDLFAAARMEDFFSFIASECIGFGRRAVNQFSLVCMVFVVGSLIKTSEDPIGIDRVDKLAELHVGGGEIVVDFGERGGRGAERAAGLFL